MSIWTLIRYAPTIISLWNRMGGTPFNEVALWGGILAELTALIARLSGVEVPGIADVVAVGTASGGAAHKTAVAREKDPDWTRRAFEPKD